MSRKISWVAILAMALMVLFTVSCEGPAGADGADGADGMDANAFCVDCHSSDNWDKITGEYAVSGHATAGALNYAGGRGSCSRCHSSEGFEGYLLGYPGEDLTQKSALSCESCHGNHSSLEEDVSAPMASVAPIGLILDETTIIDFGDASNLCANCHNSRRDGTYYEALDSVSIDGVMTAVGDGMVGINSSHAGPHYSAQVNTIMGLNGYGTSSVGTHKNVGCVGCHMGEATDTNGGHTFEPNLANCTEACHTSVADIEAFAAEKHDAVSARMTAIADALVAAGALSEEDGHYSPKVSIVSQDVFEAFWNYRIMYQDHSYGVHNPGYYNTMLTTAEAKLGL